MTQPDYIDPDLAGIRVPTRLELEVERRRAASRQAPYFEGFWDGRDFEKTMARRTIRRLIYLCSAGWISLITGSLLLLLR